jgi:hypothetical protein
MHYLLWKYSIKEGAITSVETGQSAEGKTIKVIREVEPSEIKEGDEVYVGSAWSNFIKTSPVKRCDEQLDGSYTIETQTSIYKLDIKELGE